MGPRGDGLGIEGLPLQLLIAAIVTALTVPLVYSGLDAYDRGTLETRVRGEAARLLRAAQQYWIAGGGSETLELDLRGGFIAHLEYLVVGDGVGGPHASTVRYRIRGGGERTLVAEDPGVPLVGPGGAALSLGPGIQRVLVEVLDDRVSVRAV